MLITLTYLISINLFFLSTILVVCAKGHVLSYVSLHSSATLCYCCFSGCSASLVFLKPIRATPVPWAWNIFPSATCLPDSLTPFKSLLKFYFLHKAQVKIALHYHSQYSQSPLSALLSFRRKITF